jgi:hypothetical protein
MLTGQVKLYNKKTGLIEKISVVVVVVVVAVVAICPINSGFEPINCK